MKLTPIMEKYILHWGEMGTRWGVNRTVAQIHALLYLSPKPLNAEEISETLGVARSNVSTSLKELMSWGLVKVSHVLGDRRDHFESMKDLWEIFSRVAFAFMMRDDGWALIVFRRNRCVIIHRLGNSRSDRGDCGFRVRTFANMGLAFKTSCDDRHADFSFHIRIEC